MHPSDKILAMPMSQGAVHLHPQGGEKNLFRPNLQEKCASAPPGQEVHPQPEKSQFLGQFFAGWLTFGGIFRRSLRATTNKGRQFFGKKVQLFLAKKCTPDKILATPMLVSPLCAFH